MKKLKLKKLKNQKYKILYLGKKLKNDYAGLIAWLDWRDWDDNVNVFDGSFIESLEELWNIKIDNGLYRSIEDYCHIHNIKKSEFNKPVVFHKHNSTLCYFFKDCTSFNQPIILPEEVEDCEGLFSGCTSFNQPIILPRTVTICDNMFECCTSFNSEVKLEPRGENDPEVISIDYMFAFCEAFDKDVSDIINRGIYSCKFYEIFEDDFNFFAAHKDYCLEMSKK